MNERAWAVATKTALLLLIPPAAVVLLALLLVGAVLAWCCVPFCRVYLDEAGVWAFSGPEWLR